MKKTKLILATFVSLIIIFNFFASSALSQDTVYGTISGDVQEGIKVEIYQIMCGEDLLVGTTTTDSVGDYSFSGLSNGWHVVRPDNDTYIFDPELDYVGIPQVVPESYDFTSTSIFSGSKIGVIYMLHGGMDVHEDQYMWESSIHQFSFEKSHPIYMYFAWVPGNWHNILGSEEAVKFTRKFEFEYERIGGTDPFHTLSDQQLADMKTALDNNTHGMTFEVEFASWMSGSRPGNYPYPRFLYNGPPEGEGAVVLGNMTYCGEDEVDGPWAGCDSERYNIDGPVERLLDKGVTRIIAIDMAVGGVRFYKPYDVLQMTKRAMRDYNNGEGTTVPIMWVNDYGNVMERSFPTAPENWGAYTQIDNATFVNPKPLLNGCPNPVAEDLDYALLHVEGIEAGMSTSVSDNDTGVLLFNHGLFRESRRFFDPKIDDTLVLDENIKALMLERHPEMDPDNIIGAYGGVREINPENGLYERTRPMRGEDLAHSYLHEGDVDMPGGEWGYRYWDALEYLKDQGVNHIVVSFPQVVTDSVLTLVEYYNQIGKEIGIKTWLHWDTGDFVNYPGVGHPFADYWGNWVDTDCGEVECCFEMGGCGTGFGDYPPARQQPDNESRRDMDPSLAYDLSDYGHLGYDPGQGAPDPNNPVQNQYTGTWAMYVPPSDDPRMGQLLAKHVLNAVLNPMVHITNGDFETITEGQSITWQANVQSGTPAYSYEWFIMKEGDAGWTPAGTNSASWAWIPDAGDAGTYAVRCKVTDSASKFNEVTFDNFVVTVP